MIKNTRKDYTYIVVATIYSITSFGYLFLFWNIVHEIILFFISLCVFISIIKIVLHLLGLDSYIFCVSNIFKRKTKK